jgi:hypothetical protein
LDGGFSMSEPARGTEPSVLLERLRLNPNCCYQACATCTSLRKLREFRARFPDDWESRLAGSDRLRQLAQDCP